MLPADAQMLVDGRLVGWDRRVHGGHELFTGMSIQGEDRALLTIIRGRRLHTRPAVVGATLLEIVDVSRQQQAQLDRSLVAALLAAVVEAAGAVSVYFHPLSPGSIVFGFDGRVSIDGGDVVGAVPLDDRTARGVVEIAKWLGLEDTTHNAGVDALLSALRVGEMSLRFVSSMSKHLGGQPTHAEVGPLVASLFAERHRAHLARTEELALVTRQQWEEAAPPAPPPPPTRNAEEEALQQLQGLFTTLADLTRRR